MTSKKLPNNKIGVS